MLAQSFVFKLLDLKKSSRAFLAFFVFCLFYSAKTMTVECLLVVIQRSELSELTKKVTVLEMLHFSGREHIRQSPIANGHPTFDGPPGNESILSFGSEHIRQSPIANGRPMFDGPPGNEKCLPSFDPGPPGNE